MAVLRCPEHFFAITAVIAKELCCVGWLACLGKMKNREPSGSDMGGLLADLLKARADGTFRPTAWRPMSGPGGRFSRGPRPQSLDPRALSFPTAPEAYRFLGEGKNAASLKQIRAALSFAYKHWDVKNPFAKIDPPLQKEPQIRYLLLADIRRLLDYLKARQQGYGSALAFHLANALFQTACRFDELIQLTWGDCQAVGKEIVALRIKGKGSVFHDVPVTGALSAALLEWKDIQESFKARRIRWPRRDRLCGVGVCVCGIFGGAVFQPGVQFAAARRLQSARGGGDHRPRVAPHPRPRSSLTTWERICGKSRSSSATRISAPRCAIPTSAMNRPGKRRRRSARLWSEKAAAGPDGKKASVRRLNLATERPSEVHEPDNFILLAIELTTRK